MSLINGKYCDEGYKKGETLWMSIINGKYCDVLEPVFLFVYLNIIPRNSYNN